MLTTWNSTPMLDRVRDGVIGSTFGHAAKSAAFTPTTDVLVEENEMVFYVDVPGVRQEDLEVTLEENVLSIKGARKHTLHGTTRGSVGRGYGAFALSYKLPSIVDGDTLSAMLADGVLTLRVSKQPKAQPRKINISVGEASSLESGAKERAVPAPEPG